jgi:hypothetical protein
MMNGYLLLFVQFAVLTFSRLVQMPTAFLASLRISYVAWAFKF